jgi:hypothetical protein
MKRERERAWGRVEKQSHPACGLRALTPNRQSVSSSKNSNDPALKPGTAPQHQQLIKVILHSNHKVSETKLEINSFKGLVNSANALN